MKLEQSNVKRSTSIFTIELPVKEQTIRCYFIAIELVAFR